MKDILLIDKPAGWTSFDVVAKIRSQIRADYIAKDIKPTKRQLRVGHAGTLDPFATGLLIILLGDACKNAGEFLKLDKTYEFSAKLGEVSTTGDPEGVVTPYLAKSKKQLAISASVTPAPDRVEGKLQAVTRSLTLSEADQYIPTQKEVEEALTKFTGEITQTPPAYSAIKINGKRAYKLAREGKAVEIPQRQIKIYSLELIEYSYPYLKCRCKVSSGTYIRSLVEDIGRVLGTGAYCNELRRTRIADFSVQEATVLSTAA